MKFRKVTCVYCGFEGRPVKGTRGRVTRSGMTKLCQACKGIVV